MCFSTSSCAPRQIIGHDTIEEIVMVTELTTNGALGIPRGLVSTWALVVVEAILGTHHHAQRRKLAKQPPPYPEIQSSCS